MSSQSQKQHHPSSSLESTIRTRHRRQVVEESTQLTNSEKSKNKLNKKQAAKERGKHLQKILQEKRDRGEINKKTTKSRSKSHKSGIYFPVNRVLKKLKNLNPNRRVYESSAVLLAGVLEYLTAELLELAGNVSIEFKKHRIIPRHLFLAIANDQELEILLKDAVLTQSGSVPHIHPALLKQKISKVPYQNRSVKLSDEPHASPENSSPQKESQHQVEKKSRQSKRKHVDDNNNNDSVQDLNETVSDSNKTSTPSKKSKH